MTNAVTEYGERDFGIKIKSFGGNWNREEGVWECNYVTVKMLGLEGRIVENLNKNSQNNNTEKSSTLFPNIRKSFLILDKKTTKLASAKLQVSWFKKFFI